MLSSIPFPSANFPLKAAVIIDGGYYRKILETLNISKIDLVRLTNNLCEPAYRVRSFFFDGKTQEYQSYHDAIRLMDRSEVFLGDVLPRNVHCPHCHQNHEIYTQKQVDVALAVELVHLATSKHVDLIVLVAGDRDFLPAIETAKHAGVIIKLVYGDRSTVSEQMFTSVDERVELTIEYLKTKHIQFESIETSSVVNSIPSITSSPTKPNVLNQPSINAGPTPDAVRELSQKIQQFCINYTQKNAQKNIPATSIGEELQRTIPDWKKRYNVKKLKDLFELIKTDFEWIKTADNTDKVSLKKITLKSNSDQYSPIQTLLLTTIKEYADINQGNTKITSSYLGLLLAKKDKNWKKIYKVKSLDTALDLIKDLIVVKGEGPKMIIQLK